MLVVERRPLGPRPRREHGLELPRHSRVHLALQQVLAPQPAAQRGPELRLQRAERDPAVGAGVGPVTGQPARELEPAALGRDAVGEVPRRDHGEPGLRPARHRDVDELPLAGALALVQRGEDRPGRHQRAAAEVGDLARGRHGRAAGRAAQPEQPVARQVVEVVAGPPAVGPLLAVAGDRAVHEPRVLLPQALVADAQAVEHARPERLEQDVVLADQPEEHVAALSHLQVEPETLLPTIQREEQRGGRARLHARDGGRRPADVVAEPRVLDLEHLRAVIREQERAEPARQQPAEVEHADARERPAHASTARASSTVATRRPASSAIRRARAISSPLERAIVPSGR